MDGAPLSARILRGGSWYDGAPLSARILRGGSWYDAPRFCRSAMRRWLAEDRGGPDIGFRVALVPGEK